MEQEIFVTCFEQHLSDEFCQFIDREGLGIKRMMALQAGGDHNMVQLTVLGPSLAIIINSIVKFLKSRKFEVTIEFKTESKTVAISKSTPEQEIQTILEQNKSQQFILKTKI